MIGWTPDHMPLDAWHPGRGCRHPPAPDQYEGDDGEEDRAGFDREALEQGDINEIVGLIGYRGHKRRAL